MPEAARAIGAGQKRGVLFGPERTGLSNDEVALADVILTFPVNPAYASLNLAQAVLLVGYEFFPRRRGGAVAVCRRFRLAAGAAPVTSSSSIMSKANWSAPASSGRSARRR